MLSCVAGILEAMVHTSPRAAIAGAWRAPLARTGALPVRPNGHKDLLPESVQFSVAIDTVPFASSIRPILSSASP